MIYNQLVVGVTSFYLQLLVGPQLDRMLLSENGAIPIADFFCCHESHGFWRIGNPDSLYYMYIDRWLYGRQVSIS